MCRILRLEEILRSFSRARNTYIDLQRFYKPFDLIMLTICGNGTIVSKNGKVRARVLDVTSVSTSLLNATSMLQFKLSAR